MAVPVRARDCLVRIGGSIGAISTLDDQLN